MSIELIEPTVSLRDAYNEFMNDWKSTGEELIPFILKCDYSDFEKFVNELHQYAKGFAISEGFVPHSNFWLVENEKIIGVSNVRHYLNEALLNHGGHIGYGICPSERRKGYATILLRESLKKAKVLGINKALITCKSDNIGSIGVILNNNGVFESEALFGDIKINRYWIEIQ